MPGLAMFHFEKVIGTSVDPSMATAFSICRGGGYRFVCFELA